jgi:hypothetical protein
MSAEIPALAPPSVDRAGVIRILAIVVENKTGQLIKLSAFLLSFPQKLTVFAPQDLRRVRLPDPRVTKECLDVDQSAQPC